MLPLPGKIQSSFFIKCVTGRHLGPHQQAELIAVVIEIGIFDLLVLPYTVEARFLDQADIFPVSFGGFWCIYAIRPVALIEYHAQVIRLVIEIDLPIFHCYLTHTEIGLYLVRYSTITPEPDSQVIEMGRFGTPQLAARQVKLGFVYPPRLCFSILSADNGYFLGQLILELTLIGYEKLDLHPRRHTAQLILNV